MKKALLAVLAICGLALSGAPASATLTFAGKWILGDGPYRLDELQVVSGQEEAAAKFGGSPSQYEISTVDADPMDIDNLAWADSLGATAPARVAQDFSRSDCGGPYNCTGDNQTATSAYVLDHTCNNRFADLSAPCNNTQDGDLPQPSTSYVNYAFFDSEAVAVPEPSSFFLIGTMVVGLGLLRRRSS